MGYRGVPIFVGQLVDAISPATPPKGTPLPAALLTGVALGSVQQ
jgi:hypothetical protein